MTLYSIHADSDNYRSLGFNRDQSEKVFGEDIQNQFDVNFEAKPYAGRWAELDVNFADDGSGLSGDLVPDIAEHCGRLFLSQKAYEVLKALLENDGELLPVRYEQGRGYMFNPLSIAEDVDGLDESLSIKNEWGDIENTVFHEERVAGFSIFRARFDNFHNVYCHQKLKDTIESACLNGVFFTPDLGNPFGAYQSQ